jgi:endoglucanase
LLGENMLSDENKQFFKNLVSAPSPSGYEGPAQKVVIDFLKPYADDISKDRNGNVIALKKGSGKLKVMVVGHADEIGFIVNHIDDQGYVYVRTLGGFDVNLLPSLRLDIYHQGKPIRGIIGKKHIYMQRGTEEPPKLKLEDLWIDIGALSKEEAEKKVAIGDIITYHSDFEMLSDDLVVSKATDNKCGVYVAAAVMKELKDKFIKANYYAVSSVGEETTMRGARTSAWQIEPDIAITVDVTFASDVPGVDKRIFGDIALSKGPTITIGAVVHPAINDKLIALAKELNLPYQLEIEPGRTGTDADVIQDLKAGTAMAVIGIPNRYMHSPNEVISFKDLDTAVQLITAFITSLDDDFDLSR